MKLKYFHGRQPNFGDDLNAVLWPHFAPELFNESLTEAFIGIGTIIGFPCSPQKRLNVFSSGAGNDPLSRWNGLDVTYWCVRGPLSARFCGLPDDMALCDGAILVPLADAFPRKASGNRATVIVPHWESLEDPGWDEVARLTGFELVDPRGTPGAVIGRIAEARSVLTESLHGAIIADTYGIPWSAFATMGNFNLPKWLDWALAVDRPFALTIVPPPTANGLLRHGRPAAPFGTRLTIREDRAIEDMRLRTRKPRSPRLRDQVKNWIKQTGLVHRVLDLSPERTAHVLIESAERMETPSRETTIASLQDRMLQRLDALRHQVR